MIVPIAMSPTTAQISGASNATAFGFTTALTAAAPAPRARIVRRARDSRGTCPGSRTPATATPCRRAARALLRARRHRPCSFARTVLAVGASTRSSSSAAAPISTAARSLPRAPAASALEILAFAQAAGDQHERAGEPLQRRERGADVRAFRVVDERDALALRDALAAVRQARERAQRRRAPRRKSVVSGSVSARAASAFASLCVPRILSSAERSSGLRSRASQRSPRARRSK